MNYEKPSNFGLCAGQGGFELAYESEGFECVGISENEPCANIVTDYWFGTKNFGDMCDEDFIQRVLDSCRPIDVLTGGIPCQAASLLGKRMGTDDERWLWDRAIEIVGGLRPRFAHFENPPAILNVNDGRAFNGIVCQLAEIGYDCWWQIVPAAIFGAGHIRERLFIIAADCEDQGLQRHTGHGHRSKEPKRLDQEARGHITAPDLRGRVSGRDWWHEANTGIPVLAPGLSGKLVEAACRLTGNSVVPACVVPFARAIKMMIDQEMNHENQNENRK